jgi:hypothetical protein
VFLRDVDRGAAGAGSFLRTGGADQRRETGSPVASACHPPLLLNACAANGGWAASLQVANGKLYAFAKSGGHYWIRFNGTWIDTGTAAPVDKSPA